jgi:hypothetical protein
MDRPVRIVASRPWIILGLVATLAAADAQSDSARPPAPPPALSWIAAGIPACGAFSGLFGSFPV